MNIKYINFNYIFCVHLSYRFSQIYYYRAMIVNTLKLIKRQSPTLNRTILFIYKQVTKGQLRRLLHWFIAGHIVCRWRIFNWLRKEGPKFLQIGGGKHLKQSEGWINGDILAGELHLNAMQKLPFPDNSLDVIFTEQFFEHLSQKDGATFLSEAYRVLKPFGVIRQSTPDLEKVALIYQDRNDFVSLTNVLNRHMHNHRRYDTYAVGNGCQFINDMFRLWGHKFIYDQKTLKLVTEKVGFKEFKWVAFGKSNIESLNGLERHADQEWMKNGFVMICEAIK